MWLWFPLTLMLWKCEDEGAWLSVLAAGMSMMYPEPAVLALPQRKPIRTKKAVGMPFPSLLSPSQTLSPVVHSG